MRDLTDPRWIHAKGWLFLLAGLMASVGILLDHPDLRTAFLLAVGVICFCRFYYYVFYVIEKYVDPGYRFAGLWSFAAYLWRGRGPDSSATVRPAPATQSSSAARRTG